MLLNGYTKYPAFLLPEFFSSIVEDHSIHAISFEELTESRHPWEVEFAQFLKIQNAIDKTEQDLRQSTKEDLLCICSEKGIFWIGETGFPLFLERLDGDGRPQSLSSHHYIWKLTTDEAIEYHVNNLRMIILACAHDIVFLHQLQAHLNQNLTLMRREFKQSELSAWRLITDMKQQVKHLPFAKQESVILFERCMITQEMLRRGDIHEEQLGYTEESLRQVHSLLVEQLRHTHDQNIQFFFAMNNQIKESVRQGETSQLIRFNRWEMVQSMIQEFPEALSVQFEYYNKEKMRISHLMKLREQESIEFEESDPIAPDIQTKENEDIRFSQNNENQSENTSLVQGSQKKELPLHSGKPDLNRMAVMNRKRK